MAALERWSDLDVRDMGHMMHLTREYAVSEIQVQPGDWVADKPLSELHLPEEGVLVLGIQRADGTFIGAPRGRTVIHSYDTLILYGRTAILADLNTRRDDIAGERARRAAVREREHMIAEGEDPPEDAG